MSHGAPRFEAVCFDFDSTLTRLEGIDELAAHAGVAEQIAPLTAAAMEGAIPLDAVYGARLEVVRPGREDIAWLGARYLDAIVPGAEATVATLQRANVAVYVVSGGFRAAVLPLAKKCGIAPDHVFAVEITFDADGRYEDFDRASPLTRSDGKAVVCRQILQRHRALALVGDGVTDVAARSGGAYVVGFGGVVARDAVRAGADCFVEGPRLSDVLDVLFEAPRRDASDART